MGPPQRNEPVCNGLPALLQIGCIDQLRCSTNRFPLAIRIVANWLNGQVKLANVTMPSSENTLLQPN
jgi:hypothetical protein